MINFMENHAEIIPECFLILVNNLRQQLYTRNYFENNIF